VCHFIACSPYALFEHLTAMHIPRDMYIHTGRFLHVELNNL